ncbi:MAG: mechanosensitive ion channel family protein [Beijerinckiaceae bacterium]
MNAQDVANQTSALMRLVMLYAPPVLGAFAVLIIGWILAGWLQRFVQRGLDRTKVDATLKPLIASIVRYVILGITLMVVLQQFGVETASLIAVLGTIGLAIGLALQGTLSNVAAGLMLLFLRPFEVGDHVEAGGAEGNVLGIDLFHTNLRTVDGVDIVIPNGAILSGAIKNMSRFPERIIAVNISVAADADLGKAVTALRETVAAQPDLKHAGENNVFVRALPAGGGELSLTVWVKNEQFRAARSALLMAIKERFVRDGIAFA